jgi:hypothetical protein
MGPDVADPRQLALIDETLGECEGILRGVVASPASRELRVRHATLQRVVRGWVHIPPHDAQLAAMLECVLELRGQVGRLTPARVMMGAARPPTDDATSAATRRDVPNDPPAGPGPPDRRSALVPTRLTRTAQSTRVARVSSCYWHGPRADCDPASEIAGWDFAMLPRDFLVLAGVVVATACGGSGALAPPTSDSQYDDPDDPGGGGSTGGLMAAVDAGAAPVTLPTGAAGIGFDDLRFSGDLSVILVPAGRTGDLDTVDPSTERVTVQSGFSSSSTYSGDSSFGATSADEGNGIIYVTDRTAKTLSVINPASSSVVATAMLAGSPGYVRYVAATNEVWVTEPLQSQIEIFTLASSPTTAPVHAAVVSVPNGPESLEIDEDAKTAFTNATTATVAISVTGRNVAGTYPNGCKSAKGIAVDATQGWVMSACAEGAVAVLSTQGSMIGTVATIAGSNQIAYDAITERLYVPSATGSALAVVTLSAAGVPALAGSVQTSGSGGCVATAGGGVVFVCAPTQGDLLFVHDPF